MESKPSEPICARPPPCNVPSLLDDTYDSARDLQIAAAKVERAMLDREGWLRWWKAAIPDLIRNINVRHYNEL